MHRIRTADKGRPLIISNRIIEEYSECNVDTLHKKNLLSLGEDRYLTTLMLGLQVKRWCSRTGAGVVHTGGLCEFVQGVG